MKTLRKTISSDELRFDTQTFVASLVNPSLDCPPGIGKAAKPDRKRFSVYRNNVMYSLISALADAYPSIRAILGEDNFARVAPAYVRKFPPNSPMMQDFGSSFPEFVASFPPLSKTPFLVDLARAERCWLEAFHAADALVLEASALSKLPAEATVQLAFGRHPAARLIRSEFPVFALFNARDEWPAGPIDLQEPQSILITRPEYDVQLRPISDDDATFLEHLLSGETLGRAVGALQEENDAFDPSEALTIALASGCFRDFELNETGGVQ